MVRVAALSTLLILSIGCATKVPKEPAATLLPEKFGKPYQGLIAAAPDLKEKGHRLDIFLGVPAEATEGNEIEFSEVIYCMALNPHDDDPLEEVAELINHPQQDTSKPVYIWGTPRTKKTGYWWDGVDVDAVAIAVWHPKAQDYVYIDLMYKTSIWRWKSIYSGLRSAVQAGKSVKKIIP